MSNYMPQDVFNMCAVSVARWADSGKVSIEECAKLISDQYRKDYVDDGFEKDIIEAVYNVVDVIEKAFPGKKVSSGLMQIQYCIKHYHPNGKKKRFFQGQMFEKQKTPIPDRVDQCTKDVLTYHAGTLTQAFPLAPNGWSP